MSATDINIKKKASKSSRRRKKRRTAESSESDSSSSSSSSESENESVHEDIDVNIEQEEADFSEKTQNEDMVTKEKLEPELIDKLNNIPFTISEFSKKGQVRTAINSIDLNSVKKEIESDRTILLEQVSIARSKRDNDDDMICDDNKISLIQMANLVKGGYGMFDVKSLNKASEL
ncbi:hypothetical protein Kpol_1031p51 [Vanderwaltozyma polyspora DSM 70294]|uniref:Ribosome assembly protein 3 n=1 Tax=Vanderwaltozyma polyspora (strain ATCC 22028 / DSM 70294 / BCRC 21397 / CBS 2163 / NBRC 10782 / NRRL Y-8283 / UCD 57-17) TaxID=436907 RepID=A7THY2_VANPO|nr:uncharacterized protein Kpol_1031p51 [Vanderwaltozyma polyspora DSM 70294]EDO18144.1 hypothetical protein Kpol_1031p51 [Vanderwaltozyma polyspora DSM 70294]